MKKIVVLISGRGSNMAAIAQACAAQHWPARIVAVISNRPDAPGLGKAAELGLPGVAIDDRDFSGRAAFDAALARAVDAESPDLVVLAGFMRVLGDDFVLSHAGRLVNIHPSLLPAFPGLRPHRRALDAGVRVHGTTVHFVSPEVDSGPIIAQAALPVRADDTEESLAARVLALEHRLYPMALRCFVEGRLRIDGTRVRLVDPRPGESLLLLAPDVDDAAGSVDPAGPESR